MILEWMQGGFKKKIWRKEKHKGAEAVLWLAANKNEQIVLHIALAVLEFVLLSQKRNKNFFKDDVHILDKYSQIYQKQFYFVGIWSNTGY